MKAGDWVTLVGIPENLPSREEPDTRALFQKCLGQSFQVISMDNVEGLSYQLAKLDVGHIVGRASYTETIWVEPRYLKAEG